MTYIITIVKDKFAINEKTIYKTTLNSDINIDLIIKLIKRFDDLEQQRYDLEYDLEQQRFDDLEQGKV